MEGCVLLIDDEELIRWSLKEALERIGCKVFDTDSGKTALELISKEKIDVVVLDLVLQGENGLDVLKKLKQIDNSIQVIMMTAFGSVETAVEAMKLGALDYFQKPFNVDEVTFKVKRALKDVGRIRELRRFKNKQVKELMSEQVIYASKIMEEILREVEKICRADVDIILLTGETGVGKGLLARIIHSLGSKSNGPFVTLNCTAIPDTLLESELFGYERGAFTDARVRKEGLVEEAIGGTLFLDEIGDMPYKLQGKLLRFIEDRKIRRVGASREIRVDLKLIAATNRNLGKAMEKGEFRADLYHRINLIHIQIPPLRERKEDILPLAEYFLDKFSRKYGKKIKGFRKDASEELANYQWPGNVRELSNVIERCCILEDVEILERSQIARYLTRPHLSLASNCSSEINLRDKNASFDNLLNKFKRQILLNALKECDYNKTRAARLLKMDRSTFKYQLKMLHLDDRPDDRN